MSINKQALREAALHAKTTSDWGCDADNFHDRATPDAVLALLDELEAAEKRIAELEAERDKQGRHACELFDEVAAQRQQIAELLAAGIITKVGE